MGKTCQNDYIRSKFIVVVLRTLKIKWEENYVLN